MRELKNRYANGFRETVALMALMMCLTAMSIDTILPALSEIGRDLNVQRANDNQLLVSLLIFGMAFGQMVYGPLSDSIGRKPTIYIGFGIYLAGCLLSLTTTLFSIMLVGRLLQGLGVRFPLVFGLVALSIASALFFNARMVMRFGMRLLTRRALTGISGLSSVYVIVSWAAGGSPPLWSLIGYLMVTFFGIGILFGNLNAIAMGPLGHIAGVGAAVVGSLSTLIAVPVGILIGQCYNETVLPLTGGFALFSTVSLFAIGRTENRLSFSKIL